MKCAICQQEVTTLDYTVKLTENVITHLDCFFKDIPDRPSRMDNDYDEKNEARKQLMERKTEEILNKVK